MYTSTNMQQVIALIKKYKLLSFVCGLFLFVFFSIVLFPLSTPQASFQIVQTTPANGENNVDPGEITLSFTTTKPLASLQSFKLISSPSLPYGVRYENNFPTQQVTGVVVGGVKPLTNYTITLEDQAGHLIYSWSFKTTQAQVGTSSSALVHEKETQYENQKLPLFNYVPYETNDFSIDYVGDLALEVKVKNPNIAMVKQEVIAWIKSHGVDPSTHTITYINDF